MKVYMGVTPDKYELPIAMFDSPRELAIRFGVSQNCVNSEISRNKNGGRYRNDGRRRGVRFIRIEIEDEE